MSLVSCPSRLWVSSPRSPWLSWRVRAATATNADSSGSSSTIRLVDSFWASQGVSDSAARQRIIQTCTSKESTRDDGEKGGGEEEEWLSRIPAVSKVLSMIDDHEILSSGALPCFHRVCSTPVCVAFDFRSICLSARIQNSRGSELFDSCFEGRACSIRSSANKTLTWRGWLLELRSC